MKNIKINKSFIGIANKDGSNVEIDQIEINDVEIPFAAYIKKPSYKDSVMNITNVKILNTKIKYLISNNQTLIIDKKKKRKNLTNKKILSIIYQGRKDLLNTI